MRLQAIFLSLIVMSSAIQCYTLVDNINLKKTTYKYLTQSDLQTQKTTDSEIYQCSVINQYYDTMSNTSTMELSYTLATHNYVYITFDAVFLNIQQVFGGIKKNGQIDVNGTITGFSTIVNSDYYNCMQRTTSSKVDGKTSVSLVLTHSGDINLKIKPTDLGSVARLGISNLIINAYNCGKNAELSSSSYTCVCKQGYSEKQIAQGSRGHVYYVKSCQ